MQPKKFIFILDAMGDKGIVDSTEELMREKQLQTATVMERAQAFHLRDALNSKISQGEIPYMFFL